MRRFFIHRGTGRTAYPCKVLQVRNAHTIITKLNNGDVMAADRKVFDWERIECEYRAGVKSIRQIAQEFGVSDGAIRKRAKKEEWERDLNGKIEAKADAIVRKEAVRTKVLASESFKTTEKETIEANANLVASVRITHRKDIEKARTMTMSLFDELEQMIGIEQVDLLAQLGELMYKPNDKGIDKLNDLYMKIIQMPNRVNSLKQLTDSLKTVIGLEREAFNLNQPESKGEDPFTAMLNRIAQGNSSTFQPVAEDSEYEK